jgi:GT2 family glycosyltransferase
MNVSIVIINYNTFDLTSACIRSVIQFTKRATYEIILIDNASTERDPEIFAKEFPQITLVKSSTNGGFSYANNLGIEKSNGEYVLLLNSDTELKEDSISGIIEYVKDVERFGVGGCRMIYPDGKVQPTARKFKSISWELLDLFRFIPMMMSYEKRSRLMMGKYFDCNETIECDWVNGAFFLFPGKIVEELPGKKLDDRFFMYGEDQLWCEQIKSLGYKILFYAGTTIIHVSGASSDIKKQIKLKKTMMDHELEIMRIRKGKGIYYYLFATLYRCKEGARNLIKMLVFKFTGKLVK